MLDRLGSLHRFCVNQLLYPLVLSSLLSTGLYFGRIALYHRYQFGFLLWNLFLAWIPFGCSLLITIMHRRSPRHRWLLVIPGVLWLLFLPNAPYMITDILHLENRPPVPQWYDIGMFASFAWTGCFLGTVSLNQMQRIVRPMFGSAVSWAFVVSTIGLSGLGIYLGRFLQWNSWDLFVHPVALTTNVAYQFAHPIRNPQPLGVTFVFAAFLFVCYLTFVSVEHRQAERVEN